MSGDRDKQTNKERAETNEQEDTASALSLSFYPSISVPVPALVPAPVLIPAPVPVPDLFTHLVDKLVLGDDIAYIIYHISYTYHVSYLHNHLTIFYIGIYPIFITFIIISLTSWMNSS
jgi:hypothetical protein